MNAIVLYDYAMDKSKIKYLRQTTLLTSNFIPPSSAIEKDGKLHFAAHFNFELFPPLPPYFSHQKFQDWDFIV